MSDPIIPGYVRRIAELEAEIERLTAALREIDGLNDNPAVYNPNIEPVLRRALEEPK